MIILVLSCDKNEDIFYPFYKCMEKYWKGHPEIIYATESVKNPYYRTISYNEPLWKWTKRIRQTLEDIEDDKILLMIDDCFIRKNVDVERIEYLEKKLDGNVAAFCFEKSYDENDEETDIDGMKKRKHGAVYEVSINCGLYDRKKLIDLLKGEHNPWEVEGIQDNRGYDFYINDGDYIIDWGYEAFKPTGLFKGKWCRNIIQFFKDEEIEMNYERRGFYD